jgi:hypothetical protein
MDFKELYNQLVKDFNLEGLPEEDKEEMLLEVAKTIQKQFLFDVYDLLGEKQFDALQASANMGEEFYATTLKHLVPNYEELFQESRKKVVKAFHEK